MLVSFTRWGGLGNLRCSLAFFQITLQNTMLLKVIERLKCLGRDASLSSARRKFINPLAPLERRHGAGHVRPWKITETWSNERRWCGRKWPEAWLCYLLGMGGRSYSSEVLCRSRNSRTEVLNVKWFLMYLLVGVYLFSRYGAVV